MIVDKIKKINKEEESKKKNITLNRCTNLLSQ